MLYLFLGLTQLIKCRSSLCFIRELSFWHCYLLVFSSGPLFLDWMAWPKDDRILIRDDVWECFSPLFLPFVSVDMSWDSHGQFLPETAHYRTGMNGLGWVSFLVIIFCNGHLMSFEKISCNKTSSLYPVLLWKKSVVLLEGQCHSKCMSSVVLKGKSIQFLFPYLLSQETMCCLRETWNGQKWVYFYSSSLVQLVLSFTSRLSTPQNLHEVHLLLDDSCDVTTVLREVCLCFTLKVISLKEMTMVC